MWLRQQLRLRSKAQTQIMTQKRVLDQYCDLEMWLRPKI